MDAVHIGVAQDLLRQHLAALERAYGLAQDVDQALASLAGRPPGGSPPSLRLGHHLPARPTERPLHDLQVPSSGALHLAGEVPQPLPARSVTFTPKARHGLDASLGTGGLTEPLIAAFEPKTTATRDDSSSDEKVRQASASEPVRRKPMLKKKNTQHFEKHIMHNEIEHARTLQQLAEMTACKPNVSASEEELYKKKGVAQAVLHNPIFNRVQFVVIVTNCIWVGIEVDLCRDAWTNKLVCQCPNHIFCAFFLFEILMRLSAFRSKWDACVCMTFMFDAFLCLSLAWQTWVAPLMQHIGYTTSSLDTMNVSFLRVLRLVRIARFARLTRHAPGVMLYASGFLKALQATGPLFFLLILIVYIFAVMFTILLYGVVDHFGTVPEACNFLFLSALAGFDMTAFGSMLEAGWLPWILFLAYMVIGNLVLGNMVTGVLVQVVQGIAQNGKQEADAVELERTMMEAVSALGLDGNGKLSREEFESAMVDVRLLQAMSDHDVDLPGFIDFTRSSFPVDGELLMIDLFRLAKQFCGFKPASEKDIVKLDRTLARQLAPLRKDLRNLMGMAQSEAG